MSALKVSGPTQKTLKSFFFSSKASNLESPPTNGIKSNLEVGKKRVFEVPHPSHDSGTTLDNVTAVTPPKKPKHTDEPNSPKTSAWSIQDLAKSSSSSQEQSLIALNKTVAELKRKLASRPTRTVLELIQGLSAEWISILSTQIQANEFQKLADFIASERAKSVPIYPPADQVFSWSKLCPPKSVRVVILGQDPYHGPKQAHGLAFSVCRPLPPPPSLINMYKEIQSGLNTDQEPMVWPPKHGDLTGWARQGVLLLNAVLTVRASSPNSHKDKGWESLTDAVVRYLSKECSHLVFMLWGAQAQKQGSGIDRKRHLVLQAPHPSPLSASRGFFGCGHFVKANQYLKEHGQKPIKWTALE